MGLGELRASIDALLKEIEAHPGECEHLHAQLREKVAQVEALGQAMPNDLKAGSSDEDADDFFENMPV